MQKKVYFKMVNGSLIMISLTILGEDKVTSTNIENGNWKSLIRPEMMNALIISPEKMSTINLAKFINYLQLKIS